MLIRSSVAEVPPAFSGKLELRVVNVICNPLNLTWHLVVVILTWTVLYSQGCGAFDRIADITQCLSDVVLFEEVILIVQQ